MRVYIALPISAWVKLQDCNDMTSNVMKIAECIDKRVAVTLVRETLFLYVDEYSVEEQNHVLI